MKIGNGKWIYRGVKIKVVNGWFVCSLPYAGNDLQADSLQGAIRRIREDLSAAKERGVIFHTTVWNGHRIIERPKPWYAAPVLRGHVWTY